MDDEQASSYEFKSSFFGVPSQFHASADGLRWFVRGREGLIRYADIETIRVSYRPAGLLARNYRTEIWSPGVRKLTIDSQSWKSLVEKAQQLAPYRQFVSALHRQIDNAKAAPICLSGIAPHIFWPGVLIFAATAIAFAALVVRALQTGAWAGAIFITAFLALFLWQIGGYLRDNRPGVYSAGALPQRLLPPSA